MHLRNLPNPFQACVTKIFRRCNGMVRKIKNVVKVIRFLTK